MRACSGRPTAHHTRSSFTVVVFVVLVVDVVVVPRSTPLYI